MLTAVVVALLMLAPAALAGEVRGLDLVSVGPAGGAGDIPAQFKGASADGSKVFFETSESLTAADADGGSPDIYERTVGPALVSTSATGGAAVASASYVGASSDGTRVFFTTTEKLVASDTDSSRDIYERSGGSTTLISTGPAGGNGLAGATFNRASADGSRVIFSTTESLVPTDADTQRDIYERFGAATTLLSTGPAGGNGVFSSVFKGTSLDVTRVFFETAEILTGDDTDEDFDVYERTGGATTRLSTGPAGGNGTVDEFYSARYAGASEDGTRVFIETDEVLTGTDADIETDVYERSGGVTTQLSTGLLGGNGPSNAGFRDSSADGTKIFFSTDEVLTADDIDSAGDVYQRAGGATTLISTGPLDLSSLLDGSFVGASRDGSRVFFSTATSLVPEDGDSGWRDVYERSAGVTTLVSTGSVGGTAPSNAYFMGASENGTRVFFRTPEVLSEADDEPANEDIYERVAGGTALLTGKEEGGGPFDASYGGASTDGTKVFVQTGEALTFADHDNALDVYENKPYAPVTAYVRPQAGAQFRVPLVIGFRECLPAGMNEVHGPALESPSCEPAVPASDYLAVGTVDANSKPSQSVGFLKLNVCVNGNTATGTCSTPAGLSVPDIRMELSMTDVRLKTDLTDYTGELQASFEVRITDKHNGPSGTEPGTVTDLPFALVAPCVAVETGDIGAKCSVLTRANALIPGSVAQGKRANWRLGRISVFDGGPDGLVGTADNTLFATQGVFIP